MEAEKCVCRTASQSPEVGRVYNCVDCASLGWCSQQGSPSLSRIPSIDSNGLLVRAGAGISTTPFFDKVVTKDKPERTRLDAITPWLERKRRALVDRLEDINEMLLLYGLEAKRIYNEGEVTKDEPLIICARGWRPRPIELDECAHRHPIRSSEGMWWADRNNEEEFERLRDVLVGGYRPQQEQAIRDSLATPGSLLIAALPTGFGKTRIGQVITWLNRRRPNGTGGPTLLISPLIALMDDQREQYRRFNEVLETNGFSPLKTYFLTAAEESNYSEMMQKLKNNEVDVICCSPETILNPVGKSHWVEVFLQMKKPFSTMIVDEAHMIGEWGASIRPEFQLLGWVKDRLLDRDGGLRVLLMSATITESEERELKKLFKRGLKTLDVVREDRIREDLSFNVVVEGDSEEESSEEWLSFLTSQRSLIPSRWFKEQASRPDAFGRPPLLIYTPTVKFANGALKRQVRDILCDGKRKLVKTYYGDTPSDRKDMLRKQFVNDEFRALIATSAFGMGIDKGDVWTIAYLGMPYSLKGLYQAFGRAARKSNWPMIEGRRRQWRGYGICSYSAMRLK